MCKIRDVTHTDICNCYEFVQLFAYVTHNVTYSYVLYMNTHKFTMHLKATLSILELSFTKNTFSISILIIVDTSTDFS